MSHHAPVCCAARVLADVGPNFGLAPAVVRATVGERALTGPPPELGRRHGCVGGGLPEKNTKSHLSRSSDADDALADGRDERLSRLPVFR